jgi:hypothetical protein
MVRGHDGDELLVERGLAVQVGGEKPFGQAATPPRLDKGMTNAEDRIYPKRFAARHNPESA